MLKIRVGQKPIWEAVRTLDSCLLSVQPGNHAPHALAEGDEGDGGLQGWEDRVQGGPGSALHLVRTGVGRSESHVFIGCWDPQPSLLSHHPVPRMLETRPSLSLWAGDKGHKWGNLPTQWYWNSITVSQLTNPTHVSELPIRFLISYCPTLRSELIRRDCWTR